MRFPHHNRALRLGARPAVARPLRTLTAIMATLRGGGLPATSDVQLKGASSEAVRATAAALYPSSTISIKENSGRSGARSFLVRNDQDEVLALVKVEGEALLNSHPNTQRRMAAATAALREHGLAPTLLMTGPDFYVEAAAGSSVIGYARR